MKKSFLLSILMLSFVWGFSQEGKKENMDILILKVDENSYYETNKATSLSKIQGNVLEIYCNDPVFIEFDVESDRITGIRLVDKILHPEITCVISLDQISEGAFHKNTILKVTNPFDKSLIYKAEMFLVKYDKWEETTVLPVKANNFVYETWPDIVLKMKLSNWHFE